VVFAIWFIKAVEAQRGVAFFVVSSARTLLSATVIFSAMAASFAKFTSAVAEALGKAEISLAAGACLATFVCHSFSKEVMDTCSYLAAVLIVDYFLFLFSAFSNNRLFSFHSFLAVDSQQCFSLS